jgi:hypothetical protein
MARHNILFEHSSNIRDDVKDTKFGVASFLNLFGVVIEKNKNKINETFNYDVVSSSFEQMFSTREQYLDAVDEFNNRVEEVEEWIKDFKAARRSMVYRPEWSQSNASLLKPYATALYKWRQAARRHRRETVASLHKETV